MRTNLLNLLELFFLIFMIVGCSKEIEITKPLRPTFILFTQTFECNSSKSITFSDTISDSESCIVYSYYKDTRILSLKHRNAGFNCCPGKLNFSVHMEMDSIILTEFEENANCKCNCLYDLEIYVRDLVPGKYNFRIIEPYAWDQKKISFTLDLLTNKAGTFCVTRTKYPWKETSIAQ